MDITEAAELIKTETLPGAHAQTWCDLGSGTGTFTLALATLLRPGSVIYSIDKNEKLLAHIPDRYHGVTIRKRAMNLNENDLSLPALQGVLMANFLHFINHQGNFVKRLKGFSERLLVVEYESRAPSPWVPYPLSFSALRSLLLKQGFTKITKVRTRASRFGGEMYSAFAE
jgi:hypothetical protein